MESKLHYLAPFQFAGEFYIGTQVCGSFQYFNLTVNSFHRNDGQILTWSDVDLYLADLLHQNGFDGYCIYGDAIFFGPHECIRTRHEPILGIPLTYQQRHQNAVMKKCRQPIEWQYALKNKYWEAARFKYAKKLLVDPELVQAEIRIFHLLTNIHCCFYGNQISNFYDVVPPSADEYLNMH